MRSIAVILLLTITLTGCGTIGQTGADAATADTIALTTHLPPDYRQLIAQRLQKDYVGIKDAEISNPVPRPAKLLDDGAANVCVRLRERVRPDWAYPANPTTELFSFYNGTLDPTPADKRMQFAVLCGNDRTYTPFPEANKESTVPDFKPFPDVNKE